MDGRSTYTVLLLYKYIHHVPVMKVTKKKDEERSKSLQPTCNLSNIGMAWYDCSSKK